MQLITGARVHAESPSPLLVQSMHADLQVSRGARGKDQRSVHNQLVNDRETKVLTGLQDHINKPGRREHHTSVHLKAGEPIVRGGR
ncbi:hypothetical protein MSIMFI_05553 [Mycobacterium simulans]|nr:hypothetical protein MSIMFI_05553 [Mycobacterium simulans]